MMGDVYEYTSFGIVKKTQDELMSGAPGVMIPPTEMAKPRPAPADPVPAPAPTEPETPKPKPPATPGWPPPSPTPKRVDWVREMRARLKVVEKEIKALQALEDERAELKRMIAAASAPPPNVKDINSARRSG